MPIGNGFSGGRGLGFAQGRIRIDTSEARQAAVEMKRIGRDIKQSIGGELGRASTAVDSFTEKFRAGMGRSSVNLGNFAKQIKSIRTELLAIGASGAILSKIGLDGAKTIRNYRVSFRNLLGDEEKATELMRKLTTQANDFGIEVDEVWQLARALLPSLEGNVDALDDFVKRAALLASTNPLKSTADAARAIQEYLAGQTISLQRLFNVDPNLIQEAQARFQDVGEQLDYILNRMGATEEGAREMADAWVGVKNELKLALAEGFTPLFQTLQPILRRFGEFISQLRRSHPEILKIGAGIAAIAAVGAPAILFFGQLISSAIKLKAVLDAIKAAGVLSQLGGLGGLGGAAAVGIGAIGVGAVAGNALGRGIGRATGNEAIANTTLSDIPRILRQAAVVVADGVSKLVVILAEGVTRAAQLFINNIASMVNAMGLFVRAIGQILPENLGGKQLSEAGENIQMFSQSLVESADEVRKGFMRNLVDGQKNFVRGVARFVGFGDQPAQTAAPGTSLSAGGGQQAGFSEDQTKAITNYYDQLDTIEKNRLEQRLQTEEQYQEQRGNIIEEYNRTAAREEADFNRQRTRQNMQFLRDVERVAKERVQRESKWLEELNKSIASAIAESNKRIAEIRAEGEERVAEMRSDTNERILQQEEDYQRQREQRAEEHRNRLLEAASRLDAAAIANEQRQFATQENQSAQEQTVRLQREREGLEKRIKAEQDGIEKRIAQEKAGLEERLRQEREAHAERVAEAREADAQRIADMRQALMEQQRLEDEDRAIRLQRTREDHQRQLDALRVANEKRLQEINIQSQKEQTQLQINFKQQLYQLGIASRSYLQAQETHQKNALQSFEKYWADWEKIVKDQSPGGEGFASGGPVTYTGPARVHGSKANPEYMLNSDTTSMLRSMLGNFNQAGLVAAVAGGGRGGGINMGDINIPVYPAPGMDANEIATAVRGEFEALLAGLIG